MMLCWAPQYIINLDSKIRMSRPLTMKTRTTPTRITKDTNTMKTLSLCLMLPIAVTAFSSVAVPYPNNNGRTARGPQQDPDNTPSTTTDDDDARARESSPWKVVLDIGREPLSTMPFDWARSGGRLPVKIPCDFTRRGDDDSAMMVVQPRSDTVSFTGPEGSVARPVVGGRVARPPTTTTDPQELSFALTFPQELARRDVTVPAGTTVTCTTRLYTQTELDALQKAFYDARDEAWRLGGELNDMMTVDGPPKVWNEERGRWEKVDKRINPLQWAQKRLAYARAKAVQDQKNRARPDLKDLSERGSLPGIDVPVYTAKQGVAKTQTGAVIGRWSMEPMRWDQPVSYRQ